MNRHQITLRAVQARKIPHPNSKITPLNKLSLLMRCENLPESIPFDPNPREANERSRNKKIYKAVKQSLLGESEYGSGFFDLMNRGIVILAKSVEFIEKDEQGNSVFKLDIPEGYGLADGGHTYKIISEVNSDNQLRELMKNHNQHVEVRVFEIPDLNEADTLIPAIGSGLNSSLQVDEMSIANLDGKFDNFKSTLENRFNESIENWPTTKDYEGLFGWKQTDIAYMDAKEAATIISVMDEELWGNGSAVGAYSSPTNTLTKILRGQRLDKYLSIAGDVLELYNVIQRDFREKYNSAGKGRAGALSIVEQNRSGKFSFPFSKQAPSEYRLMKGASLPILGAFKIFIKENQNGNLVWNDDFNGVEKTWNEYADILIDRTMESAGKHQRNVANAIGKDSTHWRNLRNELLIISRGL